MDPRIINDAFEKTPHLCSVCECGYGNHLIYYRCPLMEGNPICQDCCHLDMMKDDVDVKISAKLGRTVTKEFINETCKNCGLNNACQNQDLVKKIQDGNLGENNGPSEPIKTR
jgi:hypothetical protein